MRLSWILAVAVTLASGPQRAAGLPVRVVNTGDRAVPRVELTVVTYNVLHGFADRLNDSTLEARLDRLIAEVASLAPDIVILQEISATRRHGSVIDRLRVGVNQALEDRGVRYGSAAALNHGSFLIGFHEGSAVLTRAEIAHAEARVYRVQTHFPPERRIALEVTIRTAAGVLTVLGTHLTNGDGLLSGVSRREHQARELAGWAAEAAREGPAVVGGDFNAPPGSPTTTVMLDAGFTDAWAAARAGEDGYTALAGVVTDGAAMATERIDYLFVSGLQILDVGPFLHRPALDAEGSVLWPSDHIGVRAKLRPGPRTAG